MDPRREQKAEQYEVKFNKSDAAWQENKGNLQAAASSIKDLNGKAFRYEFAANIRNDLDVTTEALNNLVMRINNVPDFVEGIRSTGKADPRFAEEQLWWFADQFAPKDGKWFPRRDGANATWSDDHSVYLQVPGNCSDIK
jgi:hypothetical protein